MYIQILIPWKHLSFQREFNYQNDDLENSKVLKRMKELITFNVQFFLGYKNLVTMLLLRVFYGLGTKLKKALCELLHCHDSPPVCLRVYFDKPHHLSPC